MQRGLYQWALTDYQITSLMDLVRPQVAYRERETMKRMSAIVAGLSLAFVGTSSAWATVGACCIVTTSDGAAPTNACSYSLGSDDCEAAGGVYLGGDCTAAVCNTITICASGCDHWHVQTAIDDSNDGDLLYAYAATHSYELENLSMGGKKITIAGKTNSDGEPVSTLKTTANASVFYLNEGETNQTVIKDLVITGGSSSYGGGIYCYNSSPTISNCTISGNTASDGGGIYCNDNSNPTITDCTISNNTANFDGGGISCTDSNPTITNCTISGNTANLNGGGINCYQSSNPTITVCTITDNTANDDGGGISCDTNSSPTTSHCWISGNTAGDGGGIYCLASSPVHSGCTFVGNTPDNVYGDSDWNPLSGEGSPSIITLENCTLCGTGDHVVGIIHHVGENIISDCIDDGDLDGDGDVDVDDLNLHHAAVGICLSDVNHDGDTNIHDLLEVVAGWNSVCP